MARRGRKRKTGPRHPGGQLVHDGGPLVPEEILSRRADHLGAANAMSAGAGRAPHILGAWGILTARQVAAAEKYRRIYERWRRTQGMPDRHGADPYYPVASTPDHLLTRAESRRAAEWAAMSPEEKGEAEMRDALEAAIDWREASAIVRVFHPVAIARGVVDMVCIEDVAPETWSRGIVAPIAVKALRCVLDDIAAHFGIRDEKDVAA